MGNTISHICCLFFLLYVKDMIKLERILFYIFLFLIPFQSRDVLYWQGNEWNSAFLYLTDLIFILVLVLWIVRRVKNVGNYTFLFLFLLIAGLSLIVSSNFNVSVYRFIKLLEFGILFLYIRSNIDFLKLKNIFTALIGSGAFQSILAIGQFLKQRSLGLPSIEAATFIPGEPGVATFASQGEKIMRAYGSFSHPNVLAGFLLLAIFCLYVIKIRIWMKGILLLVLIFTLFLTFSRVALLVFLTMSLIMFLTMMLRKEKVFKLFVIFVFSCLISILILFPHLKVRFLTISFEEQAIDLRFFYNRMALAMIKEKPLLGVGVGNFVWHSQNYPVFLRAASKMLGSSTIPQWLYQPVHNIYLLIGAEMGILGLLAFILFIGRILLKRFRRNLCFLFLVFCFLILGLTDHYFWTLQSGALMFWIALALL